MKTEWLHGYGKVASVSVGYHHDPVPDWELQLATTAQHCKTVLCGVLLAWEKIKIQNSKFKIQFLLNVLLLLHHHIVISYNQTVVGDYL